MRGVCLYVLISALAFEWCVKSLGVIGNYFFFKIEPEAVLATDGGLRKIWLQ